MPSLLRPRPLAIALGAGLALAAPADAATQRIGSDLVAPANQSEARQVDTAYWHSALASGAPAAVPFAGQVLEVKVKGKALSRRAPGEGGGGETRVYIQSLAREPDGRMRVLYTSQAFDLPNSSAPDDVVTTFKPTNLCVVKDGAVALNTIGGYGEPDYPNGTPLQVFASVPGSSFHWYTGAGQVGNGGVFRAETTRERELLMQATIGDGTTMSVPCPGASTSDGGGSGGGSGGGGGDTGGGGGDGGGSGGDGSGGGGGGTPAAPRVQYAKIPKQRVRVNRRNRTGVSIYCRPGSGRCRGTVTLTAKAGGRTVRVARGRFRVAAQKTRVVRMRLTTAGRRLYRRSGRKLPVRIVAVTRPGGASRTQSRSATLTAR